MGHPFEFCGQQYKLILNIHIRIVLLTIMIIVNHKFNFIWYLMFFKVYNHNKRYQYYIFFSRQHNQPKLLDFHETPYFTTQYPIKLKYTQPQAFFPSPYSITKMKK